LGFFELRVFFVFFFIPQIFLKVAEDNGVDTEVPSGNVLGRFTP